MRTKDARHAATSKNSFEPLEKRALLSSVIGVTESNRLFQVNPDRIDQLYKETRVKNLNPGDEIVGIDYRPASNELYGLVDGDTVDRIIKINPVNGRSATTFTLTTQLSGTDFGVDFNPVADAMRITSNIGQNLRIPFATGITTVDGSLTYNGNDLNAGATPNAVAAAYTNSFPGTTSTVLYGIDATLDQMFVQNPPNAGTLVSRGPLGVDSTNSIGFDIEGAKSLSVLTNTGYLSVLRTTPGADGGARLYEIDTGDGGTLDVGIIGGADNPQQVRDITLALASEPTTPAQRLRFQAASLARPVGSAALDRDRDERVIDGLV